MSTPELKSRNNMTANNESSNSSDGFTTLRLLEEMRNDARQAEHMIDDQIAQLEELCNINESDIVSNSAKSNPTSLTTTTRVNEMNNKNSASNNYLNVKIDDHAIGNTHSPRPMSSDLHERSSSSNHNHNKQTNVLHSKQTIASLLQSFNNTLNECKKSVHRFEALIQSMNDLHTRLQHEQEADLSSSNNYHSTTSNNKSVISKADLAASATHIERLKGIVSTMWNEIHKSERKFNTQMNRLRSVQRLQKEFNNISADNALSSSAVGKDGKSITDGDLYRDDNLRMLLAEQSSLRHTSNRLNNILAEAYGTHDTLRRQREQFEAIQNKLTAIAERVPLINTVLKRIHSRRRRNAVVLGCVIALCVFIIYLFL